MAMYTELEKKSVFMAVYTTPHTHKLERTSHTVSATRMLLFAHHTRSQWQEQECCHSHITHNRSDRNRNVAIRTSHTIAVTGTGMLPFAHHTQSQGQRCWLSYITHNRSDRYVAIRTSHAVAATGMLPFAHHTVAHHTQSQQQWCYHSHITPNRSDRDVAIHTSHACHRYVAIRTSHTVSATVMLPFAHHTQSQGQEQLCCHSHITHNCSNRDVKLIAIRTSHTVSATMMLPFAHHTQSQRQGCCHSHITRMSQVCCHSHLFHVPCLGPLPCVILVDGELKAMLQWVASQFPARLFPRKFHPNNRRADCHTNRSRQFFTLLGVVGREKNDWILRNGGWRREAWKEKALVYLLWKEEKGPSSVRRTLGLF